MKRYHRSDTISSKWLNLLYSWNVILDNILHLKDFNISYTLAISFRMLHSTQYRSICIIKVHSEAVRLWGKQTLHPEYVNNTHHHGTTYRTLWQTLTALGAGHKVTAIQENTIDGAIHAYLTDVSLVVVSPWCRLASAILMLRVIYI